MRAVPTDKTGAGPARFRPLALFLRSAPARQPTFTGITT